MRILETKGAGARNCQTKGGRWDRTTRRREGNRGATRSPATQDGTPTIQSTPRWARNQGYRLNPNGSSVGMAFASVANGVPIRVHIISTERDPDIRRADEEWQNRPGGPRAPDCRQDRAGPERPWSRGSDRPRDARAGRNRRSSPGVRQPSGHTDRGSSRTERIELGERRRGARRRRDILTCGNGITGEPVCQPLQIPNLTTHETYCGSRGTHRCLLGLLFP